MSGIHSAAFCW